MRRFASDTLGGADIDLKFETGGLAADSFAPLEARRPLSCAGTLVNVERVYAQATPRGVVSGAHTCRAAAGR